MAPSWVLESALKSFVFNAAILASERLAKLAGESKEIKDKSGFSNGGLGNASTQSYLIYNLLYIGTTWEFLRRNHRNWAVAGI